MSASKLRARRAAAAEAAVRVRRQEWTDYPDDFGMQRALCSFSRPKRDALVAEARALEAERRGLAEEPYDGTPRTLGECLDYVVARELYERAKDILVPENFFDDIRPEPDPA